MHAAPNRLNQEFGQCGLCRRSKDAHTLACLDTPFAVNVESRSPSLEHIDYQIYNCLSCQYLGNSLS
jgi:hypothetical protein